MRLLILTGLIALFGLQNVWAQSNVKFIPKIGVHYANFDEKFEDKDFSGKLGYQIGADVRFGQTLYLATGAHYFKSNATVETVDELPALETDFDEKGLKIPVYVGIDLLHTDRFGIRFYGGPNYSLFFDNNDKFFNFEDLIVSENMWGAVAGVGLDMGIITLDLYREWALSDFFETDAFKNRNNLVYLSAGILF